MGGGQPLPAVQQYGMHTTYWVVLVKRDTAMTFSLSLEDGPYEHLVKAYYARVAPALDLLQILTQYVIASPPKKDRFLEDSVPLIVCMNTCARPLQLG